MLRIESLDTSDLARYDEIRMVVKITIQQPDNLPATGCCFLGKSTAMPIARIKTVRRKPR